MGAWDFANGPLYERFGDSHRIRRIIRYESASPATPSSSWGPLTTCGHCAHGEHADDGGAGTARTERLHGDPEARAGPRHPYPGITRPAPGLPWLNAAIIQRRLCLAHRGTVAEVAPLRQLRAEQMRPTMQCAATKRFAASFLTMCLAGLTTQPSLPQAPSRTLIRNANLVITMEPRLGAGNSV